MSGRTGKFSFKRGRGAFGAPSGPLNPLIISNIVESLITTTSARVAWDVSPGAQGQIEYGLTESYGSTTSLETNFLTSHVQNLSGLTSGTLYHYRIKCISGTAQVVYSDDGTFETLGVHTNVTEEAVGTTGMTIGFTVAPNSIAVIDYGPTASYGSTTSVSTLKATHSITIGSLDSSTIYHYRIVTTSPNGAVTTGIDRTFLTGGTEEAWVEDLYAAMTPAGYTNYPQTQTNWTVAQFNTLIATTVGSGTSSNWKRITFAPGTTFNFTGSIGGRIFGKSYMIIDLTNVSIIHNTTAATNTDGACFKIRDSSHHIVLRNGTLDGGSTRTATIITGGYNENMIAIMITAGCHHIEIDGMHMDHLISHAFHASVNNGGLATGEPEDIWVHDMDIRGGEQGIAVVAGRRVLIEDNTVRDTFQTALDFEPSTQGVTLEDIYARRNTIDRYGWQTNNNGYWAAANTTGTATAIYRRLWLMDNVVVRGQVEPANAPGRGGLTFRSYDTSADSKTDLRIERNTTTVNHSSASYCIHLSDWNGVRVVGNTQPLSNGYLLEEEDSINVTESGNIT